MPKYRIISELDPAADHRDPRGTARRLDEKRLVTVVESASLTDALLMIHIDPVRAGDHEPRRVISVEEIHPGFAYSDEEITVALTSPEWDWTDEPMVDPEEFANNEVIYAGGDFIWTVDAVAEALRISKLVPGLHISLLQNASGSVDYSMIEIHDDARMIYLSRGSELKHLTDDRSATGWAGVLAIARELISLSNDLH